ncbi:MAG: DEAD/DEAH box helicase [Chloroflexota bacterium]|nr:DEAD/DEAH box helicase [Chloroflexota bacterium]
MIDDDRFLGIVCDATDRNLRDPENNAQLRAVTHDDDSVLQIVAGPGSGKTTVLVLRALRSVFVDDVLPENILITTFTRKAARELRTRWLDWGVAIADQLKPNFDLEDIDLNRCQIDTLDSIVQQALTDHRLPGTLPPALAETSASNIIFRRSSFSGVYGGDKDVLDEHLKRYTFDGKPPRNRREALQGSKRLIERLVQDRVRLDSYEQSGKPEELIVEMLNLYRVRASDTNVFDFTLLEEFFLERLMDGSLVEWLDELKVILVDEYQDTNPLQEAIYFEILKKPTVTATVVGDDDQSMYRFRGGSVELFTSFAPRCKQATGRDTTRVDMVRNFRSTPEIIDFYNNYITDDPDFESARIDPPKPLVTRVKSSESVPVLGMFREDQGTLAVALAEFLSTLVRKRRVPIGINGVEIEFSQGGDLGDVVFLSHSVTEVNYDRYNKAPKPYFPHLLRNSLEDQGLEAFNPRGQPLRSIDDVGRLLGLMLLVVDPDNSFVDEVCPTNEARYFLRQWRQSAETFVASDPYPNDGKGISGFLDSWQAAGRGQAVRDIPGDWPALEVIFTLITWLPRFQEEPEHQVWLEAIARVVASSAMGSAYDMQLFQNTDKSSHGDHVGLSRQSFIRDALFPIAENDVDVDEEIMPSVPRDRLQFMTIHQAKGLEFPLVIVDVGSRFKSNHWTQRFMRFPDKISNVVTSEVDVEPHLPAPLRNGRGALDRVFDDLVRLYYVAFSRPQSVLMLVGHENNLRFEKGAIPNVALGWSRDGSWPWRQSYKGHPPVKVEPPFWEI